MNEIKAADLPEVGVVGTEATKTRFATRFTKRWPTPGGEWQGNNAADLTGNWYIDELLGLGAVVLRHGYGDEREF